MRDFAYFCRIALPWLPPFVVLVGLFMALSLALYLVSKSRGYLVALASGLCYLVPWLVQTLLR